LHSIYRYLAAKQIKHILTSNRHNIPHKHNINQITEVLENNNLTLVKADESKAIVIIDRDSLNEKVNNFIKKSSIPLHTGLQSSIPLHTRLQSSIRLHTGLQSSIRLHTGL